MPVPRAWAIWINIYKLRLNQRSPLPKLYVYVPIPLAAAIGLNPGDTVQWELLDRDELHLLRLDSAPPLTPKRARRHK
jgi:hypothetical protein